MKKFTSRHTMPDPPKHEEALSGGAVDVFNAIVHHCSTHKGLYPTVREIMKLVEFRSTNTVQHHVGILLEKGLLQGTTRSYTITGARWASPSWAGEVVDRMFTIPNKEDDCDQA